MGEDPKPLVLTQGDPAGIGIEITLRAWLQRSESDLPPFGLVGSPAVAAAAAHRFGWDVPIRETDPSDVSRVFRTALPVIPLSAPASAEPGCPDPETAEATVESIETAVQLVRQGQARAVVTNPIAKHVLYTAGFSHPGHTEFLAALASDASQTTLTPVMMLWSEALAVVPVTVHIPISAVPAALTRDLIVATGRIVTKDLRERFGIAAPRLAVAGLNPHAGESGTIGTEDRDVIAPAVADLRSAGIDARGPLPADTMFHAAARTSYDVALAMYHDQALVPIKTIAFDSAVNVTLGLPFVRTSPDHGTAFDIAGKGLARPDSLLAAIRLAARISSQKPAAS